MQTYIVALPPFFWHQPAYECVQPAVLQQSVQNPFGNV